MGFTMVSPLHGFKKVHRAIEFTYQKIHNFKVHDSVVFSIFTKWYVTAKAQLTTVTFQNIFLTPERNPIPPLIVVKYHRISYVART